MEEKRNYVVSIQSNYNNGIFDIRRMTDAQAKAIKWCMDAVNMICEDGFCTIELAENYHGKEF